MAEPSQILGHQRALGSQLYSIYLLHYEIKNSSSAEVLHFILKKGSEYRLLIGQGA